ncbi:MAG: NAD-binding protein [Thermoplasmatota archaeon]
MYIVIIGGGRVGTDLARLLMPEGHDVVLMEKDEELAETLSKQFDALIIEGDGTDMEYLKDAGVNKADVLISVTGDDKVNLIAAQLAEKMFKVPTVIARVNDPKNEGVFSNLGVENTVSTTRASAIQIKNILGDTKTILTVGGKEAQLMDIKVKDDSPISHKAIKDAGLPKGVIIVSIMRGDKTLIPEGNTILRPGDLVTLLARLNTIDHVKKLFAEKKRFGIL